MYKFLGVTDDRTTCEHCGKTNLKRTVALESENGSVYYGVNCAANALRRRGENVTAATLNVEVDAVAYAEKWMATCDLEKVAKAVWNKFGFQSWVKDGILYISKFYQSKSV